MCDFYMPAGLTPYQRYRKALNFSYYKEFTPYGFYKSMMPYRTPQTLTFYYGNPNEPHTYTDNSARGCPRSYYAASFQQ
jgi:hypothetical protein